MRKMTLALSAGLLGLIGVAAFVELRTEGKHEATRTTPDATGSGLGLYVEQARQAWQAAHASANPPRGRIHETTTDSQPLLATDSRRIAVSREELGWMQKHHYPSDEELATLATVDPTASDAAMDPHQATLLGLALLHRGDAAKGIAVLRRAAARGALYAYGEAAIAEYQQRLAQAGKSDDGEDVLRAHLEVAQILGDYKAEDLASQRLPDYRRRDPARAIAMQRYTSEFLLRLGSQAQALGVSPPGPDPRPGLAQWQDLRRLGEAGQSATVDVYSAQ